MPWVLAAREERRNPLEPPSSHSRSQSPISPDPSMNGFDLNDGAAADSYRKRGFKEAFEKAIPLFSPLPEKTTLPLFVHKNGGDDQDDENSSPRLKNPHELNSGKSRALVGWPPIKYPRRRSGGRGEEERWSEECGSNSEDGGGGRRAKCVKVKMEGVAIGRKVDLSQTLPHPQPDVPQQATWDNSSSSLQSHI